MNQGGKKEQDTGWRYIFKLLNRASAANGSHDNKIRNFNFEQRRHLGLGLCCCLYPHTPGYVRVCTLTRSCIVPWVHALLTESLPKEKNKVSSMSAEEKGKKSLVGKERSPFISGQIMVFPPPPSSPPLSKFRLNIRKSTKKYRANQDLYPLVVFCLGYILPPSHPPPPVELKLSSGGEGGLESIIIINFGTFQRPALGAGPHRLP